MFAEISYIKMHNDFYALCRNSFKVPELHKELRDELFDLNLILQQQFEHQRQLRENEEEILRRKNEEKQSKFESRLNLAVFCFGLLTFISVWKDFTDMVSDGFRNNEIKSLIELGGVIIVLVLVVFGLSSIRRKK